VWTTGKGVERGGRARRSHRRPIWRRPQLGARRLTSMVSFTLPSHSHSPRPHFSLSSCWLIFFLPSPLPFASVNSHPGARNTIGFTPGPLAPARHRDVFNSALDSTLNHLCSRGSAGCYEGGWHVFVGRGYHMGRSGTHLGLLDKGSR
jgi:hypothetical protein